MKKYKVLFLADYAPTLEEVENGVPFSENVNAQYHFDLYMTLKNCNLEVIAIREFEDLINYPDDYDFIFSVKNQGYFRNTEVFISAYAEYKNKPYIGARPNVRAIAEDKQLAKLLAFKLGIPTAEWMVYNTGTILTEPNFKGPYFVKPRFGANSKHIDESNICESWIVAKNKIKELHQDNIDVILEKQIIGIYNTCPTLGNFGKTKVLNVISQRSTNRDNVVDNAQKLKIKTGLTREVNTNPLLQKQLEFYCNEMLSLISPFDYVRFDFITDNVTGISYFLEMNICCSLGKHSSFAQSAESMGIDYDTLIRNIFYSSTYRQLDNNEAYTKHKL